ncbi:MAG: PH domain-containing protein [Candidatus Spechtbacterales bacterium]|nr:PH domain-containing protein [Candidatus Spechtbacterales bacterium]
MIELYEGEKILLKKRRHWYAIASESVVLVVAAIAPLLLLAGYFANPGMGDALSHFIPVVIFAYSVWLLMLWVLFFVLWTDYYLDIFIVTNKRVIDIEQKGLFAHDIAETRLENIQDVKVAILGIIPSLMDFGDLHVQTAGEAREMVIKKIPKAHEVREVISRELNT